MIIIKLMDTSQRFEGSECTYEYIRITINDHVIIKYRIRGNFRGMKFLLNRKQTGFSRLYFCGLQVHCGKVACYVLLKISNCCKIAKFHGLNFRCISSDHEIREIYIPQKFLRVRHMIGSAKPTMFSHKQSSFYFPIYAYIQ